MNRRSFCKRLGYLAIAPLVPKWLMPNDAMYLSDAHGFGLLQIATKTEVSAGTYSDCKITPTDIRDARKKIQYFRDSIK